MSIRWDFGLAMVLPVVGVLACSSPETTDDSKPAAVEAVSGSAAEADAAMDYDALLSSLKSPPKFRMDAGWAGKFAELSLHCVDQEYPNKPEHVMSGDEEVKPPRELHPVFYGCFDWHSAVHGHWAMVRLLKKFPDLEVAGQIRAALDKHLTEEHLSAELAYLEPEHHALFERPYGWGWLLRLKAELDTFDDPDAKRWSRALAPLSQKISELTRAYLEKLTVPVRAGTHHSTAFALTHVQDYAIVADDHTLQEVIKRRSLDFFGQDTSCPAAYEPSGEDFISPCLVEADLMRRILPQNEFAAWLDGFLPPLDSPEFKPLLNPVEVKDRKDPKIGHLIGLFLQRAASYKALAEALPKTDPRRIIFFRLSAIHQDEGLAQMFDSGYGGAHWLATFAIYLLTDAGPY